MNPFTHAIRVGISRGWIEFMNSLRAPQDLVFYIGVSGGALAMLVANSDSPVEGTSVLMPSVLLPSILAALLVFGNVIGPAYTIAAEREDGTLLRSKALPYGTTGYATGQVVLNSAGMVPPLAIIIVPSLFLFDSVMSRGAVGWLLVIALLVLGTLATLPIGIIAGSLAKSSRLVGTWVMAPLVGLVMISGILGPIDNLWGWVQGVAQVFPMYWLGLGMRTAFLPDSAVTYELGDSWRTVEVFGVLGAWAIAGLVLAPIVLRRMARREAGSLVEARKQEQLQRIG
jgi:ABC-2 type transport system permease protein